MGNSKATFPVLAGESSSLSPCPDCDGSCIDKGVLGGSESANLTDLAGESSQGDPGIPEDLEDSIRKFLIEPLPESGFGEGRGL